MNKSVLFATTLLIETFIALTSTAEEEPPRPLIRHYNCNGAKGGTVSIINLDPQGSLPFPDGRQGEYILFQSGSSQGLVHSSEELDVTNEIFVVVHGLEKKIESTYQALIDELFAVKPLADIIFVDWLDAAGTTSGVKQPYEYSASNTRVVGGCMARWLEANRFFDATKAHCIGLGLGAHVCGFAGKTFTRNKWARITALDPVEREFSTGEISRVARGDTIFLDVIHSSCLTYNYGIGHVDFFLNNLTLAQPGCKDDDISCLATPNSDSSSLMRKDCSSCNHIRSLRLFISSISEQCCLPFCSWYSSSYCRQAGYWSYNYPYDKVGNFFGRLPNTSYPFCTFRAQTACHPYVKSGGGGTKQSMTATARPTTTCTPSKVAVVEDWVERSLRSSSPSSSAIIFLIAVTSIITIITPFNWRIVIPSLL